MATSTEILRKLAGMSECELLARLVWGESRGEPPIGQLAVASVVMNRFDSGKSSYGAKGGLRGVMLKPWQFSCFNPGDPNLYLMLQPPLRDPFVCCQALSRLVLDRMTKDPTEGATHYFNPEIVPGGWPRSWDKTKMRATVEIGRHVFYREIL